MNRKIILFLLVLVSICAISHVSAADNSDIQTQITGEIAVDDSADKVSQDADDSELSDEDEEFREIQYLIDNAQEGDTISLEGKNYTCDYLINVNKPVTIDGNGATIKANLSTNYQTSFFNVNSSSVVLKNIKFNGAIFLFGGAITWQGDDGIITNCEFSDNMVRGEYAIAGALLILGNNCHITDCTFRNNEAYQHGGAILANATGTVISNCEFINNKATNEGKYGGAVLLWGDDCLVENSTFTNNYCTHYGGAIALLTSVNNRIVNCKFNGNYVTEKKNLTNQSDFIGGGAIFSISDGLVIDNCSFIGNTAPEALGGAISLGYNNTVKNSTFKENSALVVDDIFASESSKIISNSFLLGYQKTIENSVYGVDESVLLSSNNIFNKTKINSAVTFSAGMVFEYTRSGSITVKVDGGIVELKNIRVLNHPEAKISFSDNLLTVSGLDVGSYTLRVTTTPDENHNAVDGDLPITVNKATAVIKASAVTVALKKGNLWTVTIVDSVTNAPISGMQVTLKVYTGSKVNTVTLTTDANGVASYQTKGLAQGTHLVVVSATHSGYNFNTLTSSIKVIKPKALTIKIQKRSDDKKGSLVSFIVKDKKTKKGLNGVKLKLLIYTGKSYITINLKTKKVGKYKGAVGYSTNKLSVGKHKVVLMPAGIEYTGSKTTFMKIKKSAKKYPAWETKVSG